MASSTNPPSNDLVSNLVLSDTFYTWFNVSNDIINKLNPIEVYSISADARDYTTAGADGVTIDDLGNGNYRIGYIMPSNITGGHTFHQDINFAKGVSGEIVNTLNGTTGEAVAVTQVSGKPITTTVAGVANIEAVVLEINGISAATAGGLTLDLEGLGVTGEQGSILSVTGGPGGTGAYSHNVKFFTPVGNANPLFDQTALRLKGLTQGARAVMGGETFGVNYRLKVDGTDGVSGAIEVHGDNTKGAGILLIDDGSIRGEDTLTLMSGDPGSDGTIELQVGNSITPNSSNTELSVGDGYARVHNALKDGADSPGGNGQVLSSTVTGTAWVDQGGQIGTAVYKVQPAGGTPTNFFSDSPSGGSLTEFILGDSTGTTTYYYAAEAPSTKPIVLTIAADDLGANSRCEIKYEPPSGGGFITVGIIRKTAEGSGAGQPAGFCSIPMAFGSAIQIVCTVGAIPQSKYNATVFASD